MGQIRILPDVLVNKIAAGEVIERPASAVKELVENAIDAGARRIRIELEDGGRALIRVTDDGRGMDADDLRLSIHPHATSKIAAEDDLFAIGTMGFRGEALPSMAAVSQLRIVSRRADDDGGHEISASGAEIGPLRAIAAPPGTLVELRNLFFNVPARRKFLRGAATEFGHVVEQLARLALAAPEIGFELWHNGRATHTLPAGESIVPRIAALYGRDLADGLLACHRQQSTLELRGYLAPPAAARGSAKWQFVFVNGRFVRDRFIQHAIKEAYRSLVEHTRYPVVFLFLRVEPGDVDVNVHPTKIEVRWRDSNIIHSIVLAALRDTLLRHDLTPQLASGPAEALQDERQFQVRRAIADFFRQESPQKRIDFGEPAPRSMPLAGFAPRAAAAPAAPSGTTRVDAAQPGAPDADRPPALPADRWSSHGEPGGEPAVPAPSAPSPYDHPPGRPHVLQLHNTYLVAETDDGMIIVDQHALHERVIFEQLSARMTAGPLEAQRLLLPEPVPVSPRHLALLEEHEDLLRRLGIEAAPFGPDSAAIHSFPVLLARVEPREFLIDLLDKLDDKGRGPGTEELIHAILDMMACKAAVKAGDPLTPQEIETLLEQRHLVDRSSNCPHGRPTTLRMSIRDLERQFKRT